MSEPVRFCKCVTEYKCCQGAAFRGHLDCLMFLRGTGYDWNDTAYRAACIGRSDILEWAVENGCPLDASACEGAAASGSMDMLRWLRARGCPWTVATCSSAAYGGFLEVLKWARDNGCEWDEETTLGASSVGSLECLEYALGNGCPWNPAECLKRARCTYNLEIRKWIKREMGSESSESEDESDSDSEDESDESDESFADEYGG